jgi:hypothetical protein
MGLATSVGASALNGIALHGGFAWLRPDAFRLKWIPFILKHSLHA